MLRATEGIAVGTYSNASTSSGNILTSGSVGIGTTTPQAALHVVGSTITAPQVLQLEIDVSGTAPQSTNSTWTGIPYTTVAINTITGATTSNYGTGSVSLPAGQYEIELSQDFLNNAAFTATIRLNVPSLSLLQYGSSVFTGGATWMPVTARLHTYLTLPSTTSVDFEYWVNVVAYLASNNSFSTPFKGGYVTVYRLQ